VSKTILITGCSSGFGKLMVDHFVSKGHRVIATMRNPERAQSLFKFQYDNLHIEGLDVSNDIDRKKLATVIASKFQGQLDVLINNAGFGAYGAIEDMSEELLRKQMEVNFFGAALLTRDMLPMLRKSRGKIINISSVMGIGSMPLSAAYSASKFALEGLAEGLAYELAPFGVQVSNVQPGRHRTGFVGGVQWASNESSAYRRFVLNLKAKMAEFAKGKEIPASNVVKVVSKLVEKKKIPLQVLVGQDAVSFGLMKRLLPTNLFYSLMARVYQKALYLPVRSEVSDGNL
jgi:NAD(P)-dependent dehydrogenase (short-subunit alcohol dehydrogenase family)